VRRPSPCIAALILVIFVLSCGGTAASEGPASREATEEQAQQVIEPSPTPFPTPVPTPTPPPRPEGSILDSARVISYYGHPLSATLGVLGSGSMQAVYQRLRQQAAAYQEADPSRAVKTAFHLIYAVAQASPGDTGEYLYHTDPAIVQSYLDFTAQNDMLLFLDLQNGRADVEAEVGAVLPYLLQPQVHLALDPEFTMPEGKKPGISIGDLNAAPINAAQKLISDFVLQNRLANKVLVIHQFLDSMVLDKENIRAFPGVDLVFDMDGFGDSGTKVFKYDRYTVETIAKYHAIKLFYNYDTDLMSPQTLLGLQPPPDIVIYQ
jgi:hypothetical protein